MRYGLVESGSVPFQWEYYGESRNFALKPPSPLPGGNASPSKPAPICYPNDLQAAIYTSAWSKTRNTTGMARTQTALSGVQSTVI